MTFKARAAETLIAIMAPSHAVVTAPARTRAALQAPMTREKFIGSIPLDGPALEIGPLDLPAIRGPNVAYFDVFDTKALRRRSVELGRSAEGCPHIDFVSSNGDLAVVDRRFDAVLSSHAIEHQPDFIGHLNAVERLLMPGGSYHVAIPDYRYSFDHFAQISTIDEMIAAHEAARTIHSEASIRAHYERHTHNVQLRHWLGLHGAPAGKRDEAMIGELCARARVGDYVDVHAWTFSPASFRGIVDELHERGLIGLTPVAVFDTRFSALEFYAVFSKPGS